MKQVEAAGKVARKTLTVIKQSRNWTKLQKVDRRKKPYEDNFFNGNIWYQITSWIIFWYFSSFVKTLPRIIDLYFDCDSYHQWRRTCGSSANTPGSATSNHFILATIQTLAPLLYDHVHMSVASVFFVDSPAEDDDSPGTRHHKTPATTLRDWIPF